VNGQSRVQIAMFNTNAGTLLPWTTQGYASACSSSFWTYMRDLEFSPDASYFAVATTGAPFIGTLCDTAARWENTPSTVNATPTWADWSGGDTLTAVAVTSQAVYVGGHNRWMNNDLGRDRAPVFGQRSPSLVYDTGTDVPADALFVDYHEESGAVVTVEVFPRADGSTLVTAFSDQTPLPLEPATVTPNPSEIGRLQAISERLSPVFQAERIVARQACFRPVTQDGLPLIGKALESEHVYVATGHSVWGILNAPATGEALAELIADGISRSTDLTPFDPARLRPFHPALQRSS
jgi:glycine/D-amino acid oxidase-like deaminating enzyme